ncbi:MAG TPA: YqaJ viral recombinase family protein, partial [Candidatus Babeliaceae bacterium]|nr:YqaJ viral recombinase family protein [Candidatus Babeliaceae bacterium]
IRQTGLGGSDISILFGAHPYKTQYDLWLDKTSPILDEEETNEAIRWGNLLEPVILKRYLEVQEEKGQKLTIDKEWKKDVILRHPEYPYLLATPDALFVKDGHYTHGLEIKTTATHNGSRWGINESNKVPYHYYLQVVHYMLVTGLDEWDMAVLIGGNDFRTYKFKKDLNTETKILELSKDFWENHILKNIPPE